MSLTPGRSLFFAALAAAAATAGFAAPHPAPAPLPLQVTAANIGQKAYDYTAAVVAFGERTPGSAAHKKTEDYITQHLTADHAVISYDNSTAATPDGPKPCNNIIAKFGPANGPIVMIAGHYDTKILKDFVGANDGGSSTGLLLALADAYAAAPPKMGVWLLFLDDEEAVRDWTDTDSVYGARHLAEVFRKTPGLVPRIRGLILVDMIGDADLQIEKETNSTTWLQDFVAKAAKETGNDKYFFHNPPQPIDDDHGPFLKDGIPCVDLIDFSYGPPSKVNGAVGQYWHTPLDTMDKLSVHSFQVVGSVVMRTVTDLINQG